jgi:hypothetical protein
MKNLIPIAQITSLVSFILGTILLILYIYLARADDLISVGIIYLITTFIINSILLIILLVAATINSNLRIELIKTCGIMLLNIPIAYGYFWIVISLN